jgi:hypothetical protein
MRRIGPIAALLALAACAGDLPVPGGNCGGPVRVTNEARLAVEQLYLREPGQAGWGRDLLAPGELAPGALYEGRVGASPVALRAVFVDGTAVEVARIEVCGAPDIRLGAGAASPPRR